MEYYINKQIENETSVVLSEKTFPILYKNGVMVSDFSYRIIGDCVFIQTILDAEKIHEKIKQIF